ncbi:MAG TPA: ATP-dependent sacrificial sulfur transferase LarE [Bacillota bacterium]|nr:ATP-dependent sacrificial sulfur transferase LarE [Bacillota bacterium]HOB29564.1 ATP-dependent sacrificial sulfur transferase LarE [Bacillota bacterium]HPZ42182.1 ATP-dependent sacrificial sulfur transferase LarE [Bacillota bacterium]HQD52996.1 ATP-dependent sacrificial sulfur transferase LarE [Bacillota bacterium]
MHASLTEKEKRLDCLLGNCGKALVAFSGGVDSTFLLYKAATLLGPENILAVTAFSPIRPAAETGAACTLAAQLKVPHRLIRTAELSREPVLENRPDRCYHCKQELCNKLVTLAAEQSYRCIIDGANYDDLSDYRPGAAATRACGVRSPLQEASLGKKEIRQLSRRYRLPTWNRPAESCLATRFSYGEKLEPEKLKRVEKAELFLRSLGLQREIRVRSRGDSARIEVHPGEIAQVWNKRAQVVSSLQEIGFLHVALDLEGYSPGRMNRSLAPLNNIVAGPLKFPDS